MLCSFRFYVRGEEEWNLLEERLDGIASSNYLIRTVVLLFVSSPTAHLLSKSGLRGVLDHLSL